MITKNTKNSKSEIGGNESPRIYVGVDLSKKTLDVMSDKYKSYPNTDAGITKFCNDMKQLGENVVVVYEATGSISMFFALELDMRGIRRCQVSPRMVRYHAKAGVSEAKTDKLDSAVIKSYAISYSQHIRINEPMGKNHLEMVELHRNERFYTQCIAKMKQILSTEKTEAARVSLTTQIQELEKAKKEINKQIYALIKQDQYLQWKMELLMQEVGVGKETAKELVINCPELGTLSRRQIAALAGVAPFNYESGNKKGKRMTRFGRRSIRNLLYMCVRSALNAHTDNDYQKMKRRLEERSKFVNLDGGKNKQKKKKNPDYMKIMVACMRKMIVRLNAKVRDWIKAGRPDPTPKEEEKEKSKKKKQKPTQEKKDS